MLPLRSKLSCVTALAALVLGCGDDGRATASATAGSSVSTISGSTGDTQSPTSSTSGGGLTDASSEPVSSSEPPGTSTSTTDAPTSSSTSAASTTDATDSGVSASTGTTAVGPEGCKQVDFLFVIDNSVSMEGEQTALTMAFPGFIDTIKNTLPTSDYHIMVADTDAEGRCAPGICTHSTCQAQMKYACKDIFSDCDTTRGAGVVHPAGEFASNMPCDFEPGKRYLLGDDPALTTNFQCAAKVGTAGNGSERPMDGMVEAVSPALLAPGACNEGFLRDGAILVVTFISDDPNVEDMNTAQETFDAIVAAKGGDVDKIVMLGLIPGGDGCGGGGKHWADMISKFGPRGIQGSICAPEFNTFFQDAVDTILDTCVINPG